MKDKTRAIWAMTLIAIVWVVNAFTLKLDAYLATIVISTIAGLGGYVIAKRR